MRKAPLVFPVLFVLLVLAAPVWAAEADSVSPPSWFAWLMVFLAVGIPLALLVYLRNRGRL